MNKKLPFDHSFTVWGKEMFGESVLLLRLNPCEKPLKFRAGQYLTFKIPLNGIVHERPFSIASSPGSPNSIELLVKLLPDGIASNFFRSARVGDVIFADGPSGDFYVDRLKGPSFLVSSGTGIAPFHSIVQDFSETHQSGFPVTLVPIARSSEDVLFYDRFNKYTVILNDFSIKIFQNVVSAATLFVGLDNAQIYLCGAPRFIFEVQATLKESGFPEEGIHYETFL